jgi:hypothetical protein
MDLADGGREIVVWIVLAFKGFTCTLLADFFLVIPAYSLVVADSGCYAPILIPRSCKQRIADCQDMAEAGWYMSWLAFPFMQIAGLILKESF